jgi:two-component system, OmpR family, response regulator CpxR
MAWEMNQRTNALGLESFETAAEPEAAIRLLLVDDDRELCRMIAEYLAPEGFAVTAIHDGAQALPTMESRPVRMMILDVMLPGLSGLEVLRRLRAQCDLPVLMLTARGDDVDRVVGLELGADDYLPKPFNARELVARVRSILRRAQGISHRAGRLAVGQITLDRGARQASFSGESLALTGAEFRILEALMQQAGDVVSREQLVQQALGRRLLPWDRSVDTHISNLRRKLAQHGGDALILSVRGSGYQLAG